MKIDYTKLKHQIPIQVLQSLNLDSRPELIINYPQENKSFLKITVRGLSEEVFFALDDIQKNGKINFSFAPQSVNNVNPKNSIEADPKTVIASYSNWLKYVDILRKYYSEEPINQVNDTTRWIFSSLYDDSIIGYVNKNEIKAEVLRLKELEALAKAPEHERKIADSIVDDLSNDLQLNELSPTTLYEKFLLLQSIVIKNTPSILKKFMEGVAQSIGEYVFTRFIE